MPETIAPEALRLADHIRPGDALIWGQMVAEPLTLTETLNAQCAELGGIGAFVGMSTVETIQPESAAHIDYAFAGGAAHNHRFARDGGLNTLPIHISRLPRHIASGDIPCDVAMIHAAPDGDGHVNLALSADYMGAAVAQARTVIAEVNDRLPRTRGDTRIPLSEIDVVVPTSRAPCTFASPKIGDAERAIGAHIARLVPDRATVQMGVGSIPDAALDALGSKRDLGVHTGLMTDKVVELVEAGVITNRYKEVDEGVTVAAILYGTERLYGWAQENDAVAVRTVDHLHNQKVLTRFGRFFAINAAIEIDLTGQVNGEIAAGRPVGLIGGQVDFARAGLASAEGRSILAMRATARKGTLSTIVSRLASGVVTTARSDVDVVVTEYGIAELAGRPVQERARSLIAIAHPDFRKELEAEVDRLA